MSPEFCLRWNNHRPNLVNVFKELLQHEVLVDVTLAAGGQFIHAHRLVLSACSLYFKELFAVNPCQHPIVILKDLQIEDVKTVVDFIYQGEVNVAQERLPNVLKTAESLRIKGLAENPHTLDDCAHQSSQHLSSSLSSSREQSLGLEGEDTGLPASSTTASTPPPPPIHRPPHKRRRLLHHDDNSHDGSSENVRVKEEPSIADPEHSALRVRDSSTLIVHGSSALSAAGEEGVVGSPLLLDNIVTSSPSVVDTASGGNINPDNPNGHHNVLSSDPSSASIIPIHSTSSGPAALANSPSNGDAASAVFPELVIQQQQQHQTSLSAASSPGLTQGRKRAVLQRQPGIIKESGTSVSAPLLTVEGKRSSISSKDDAMVHQPHQYSEYILPNSISVSSVAHGADTLQHDQQQQGASSVVSYHISSGGTTTTTTADGGSGSHHQQPDTCISSGGSSLLLQVPAVMVGGASQAGLLPKQISQPELHGPGSGPATIVQHQYIPQQQQQQHPLISRSLGSMGSTFGYHSQHTSQQGQPPYQVMQVLVKQQQQQQQQQLLSRSSSTGSISAAIATSSGGGGNNNNPSTITALSSAQQQQGFPLRQIQPKPVHEDSIHRSSSSIKDESSSPGGHHQQHPGAIYSARGRDTSAMAASSGGGGNYHQQPPLIRLTPSQGDIISSGHGGSLSRAQSDEPSVCHAAHLLPPPLTQSVSEDTGLQGPMMSHSAAANQHSSSSTSSGRLSSSALSSPYLSTLPPTSGHRLALRDGPALGCNFCWNSTDDHGRIQRRKTKYHCPECRTNLCIVPCYQKYHKQMERADDTEKQITKILTKAPSL